MTVFEEGRKVYVVNSDEIPEVLLDFGLQERDIIDNLECVISVGSKENQGYSYRTITIDTAADCSSYFAGDTEPWNYYLIEGIGVSKDQYLRDHHFLNEPNTFSYLLRCWKNGNLVYQAPGYDESTGIIEVRTTKTGSAIYDLQGRRLNILPQKGMYISDNRKIVIW